MSENTDSQLWPLKVQTRSLVLERVSDRTSGPRPPREQTAAMAWRRATARKGDSPKALTMDTRRFARPDADRPVHFRSARRPEPAKSRKPSSRSSGSWTWIILAALVGFGPWDTRTLGLHLLFSGAQGGPVSSVRQAARSAILATNDPVTHSIPEPAARVVPRIGDRSPARVAEPESGYLSLSTTPSATVTVQIPGQAPWVRHTPFEYEKLPAGNYEMQISNAVLGVDERVPLQIVAGKTARLERNLKAPE